MSNGTAQVISKIGKGVQVWHWPTLPQPWRVQTREPGKSYRLHSAHDTQKQAEAEARRVAKLTPSSSKKPPA